MRRPVTSLLVLGLLAQAAYAQGVPYFRYNGGEGTSASGPASPNPEGNTGPTTPTTPAADPTLSYASGGEGVPGAQASFQPTTANVASGKARYTVVGTPLPPTLQLDPSSGAITGTYPDVGTYATTIQVEDLSTGKTGSYLFNLVVQSSNLASAFFPSSVSNGSVGAIYDSAADTGTFVLSNQALVLTFPAAVRANGFSAATSGGPVYLARYDTGLGQWVDIGNVGANPNLGFGDVSSASWRLSGTGANFSVTTARLTYGGAAPVAPSIVVPTPPDATVGTNYSYALQANDTSGTAAWALASGSASLPTGLQLTTAGVIQGTPQAAASVSVSVTVTDPRGVASAPRTVAFDVASPIAYAEFDPARTKSGGSLDLTRTVLTNATNGNNWVSALANTAKSSGKWYLEFVTSASDAAVGFSPVLPPDANASQVAGGVVLNVLDGQIYTNTAPYDYASRYSRPANTFYGRLTGRRVMLAWDGSRMWVGLDGSWMNGNPVNASGGFAYAPGQAVYPVVSLYQGGSTGRVFFDPAKTAYAAPAGFQGWH